MATLSELTEQGYYLHNVDNTAYKQGRFLIGERRVEFKHLDDDKAVAYVFDDQDKYTVELWERSGRLEASCSCPADDAGGFCAHEIAVALSI